ncbi:MAG: SLC13 family permease [Gammaproteobacteria bacterium]|nr:SLC13 family permease [Gammaproteobacteria bacterium]
MPALPGMHALVVIGLMLVALWLFTRDRIPLEATSLGVLLFLVGFFQVFPFGGIEPQSFLVHFGNEALVTVVALLVLGQGLEITGALQPLAALLTRYWLARPQLALAATLVTCAISSAFINNLPMVAVLMPIMVACCLKVGTPVSQVLMPMNFANTLGMWTTIGTSTNLLAVGIAVQLGVDNIGIFDFAAPGLMGAAIGVAYLLIAGPFLLPERQPPLQDTSPRVFNAALHVNERSPAQGKSIAEVLALTQNRMRIDQIQRGEDLTVAKLPSVRIRAGDRLLVRDTPDRLKEFEQLLGATLFRPEDVGQPVSERNPLSTAGQQLAEIVVTRASPLYQTVLDSTELMERYGLLPLAVHRGRAARSLSLDDLRLRAGDVILVQGTRAAITGLRAAGTTPVLDGTVDLPDTERARGALAIMTLVVLLGAFEILPMSIAGLLGVALMLGTRCLRWRHVGEALDPGVVMIMVASLALGTAMLDTGAAEYIANLVTAATAGLSPAAVLSILMAVVTALTQVVSAKPAAALGTPISISIAHQLGVAPEPFVVGVIFAVNLTFVTPIGHPTNVMIMTAGGYRFVDFVRFGLPLAILMWAAFSIILPAYYGLAYDVSWLRF